MCGIYAGVTNHSITTHLIDGLNALSYRGYDSAGIALISKQGLERRRAKGKLDNLTGLLKQTPLEGKVGIAHTRWATHGKPECRNAHPHMTLEVAVAHNGIIENYAELRKELEACGFGFESETDSETIPLLITCYLHKGMTQCEAIQNTLARLEGSFAIVALFDNCPDQLFAARQGSPLVIGHSDAGFYLSSDENALIDKSDAICHMQDGDLARITHNRLIITDFEGNIRKRVMTPSYAISEEQGKQGYRHYMLKEIYQQPAVIQQTLDHYLQEDGTLHPDLKSLPMESLCRLSIVACGTSSYAGVVAKYWMEEIAGLPVDIDIASEYRYRNTPYPPQQMALFTSQSGETADTLAALRHASKGGQQTLSLVNVTNSSMASESDRMLPLLAGQEIGVASTKAFTAQLATLLLLTLVTARSNRQITQLQLQQHLNTLNTVPRLMDDLLNQTDTIRNTAQQLYRSEHATYLGRGIAYPLALEGALKLKEISYIHAQAYPAGELKHGPIALIDERMPVIIIAPPGPLFSKTLSNLREVHARGGNIILLSNQAGIDQAADFTDTAIVMPEMDALIQPLLYTLPLQLLAYYVALYKGTDIDQPRNLAKSVTVE